MSTKQDREFYQNKLIYLNEQAAKLRTALAGSQKTAYADKESELQKNRKRLFMINVFIFVVWILFTVVVFTINLTQATTVEGFGTVGIGFIHGLVTDHLKSDINDIKKDLDKIIINWEYQINSLDKSFNQEQQGLERSLGISADRKVTNKKKTKK